MLPSTTTPGGLIPGCVRNLARCTLEVTAQILPLVIRKFFVPFSSCGIVVGAGVYNRVGNKVARQIRIVGMAIEGELQNASAGYLKLIAESVHPGCNQAQVLSDKWQGTELGLHRLEKTCTRPRHPLSRLSRWRPSRDVPCSRKTSKVIQANYIYVSQQGT